MKIICISGKAQHGKDTAAGFLKQELESRGSRVLIAHQADLLKYICRTFFGWDGQKDERGRALLQYVGTDVFRRHLPDFWVSFLGTVLELFKSHWDYAIIPDCRFPNEIDCLREAGMDVVHLRIERTGFTSPLTPEQQAHPSETALDSVTPDKLIKNDGSREDLRAKLAEWMKGERDDKA